MSIFVHSIDLHSEPIKREGLASFPRVLSLWSMCNTRIITRYWTNNLTSYCPVTIWVTIRTWKLSLRGWPRQSAAYHPQPINENDYQQIENSGHSGPGLTVTVHWALECDSRVLDVIPTPWYLRPEFPDYHLPILDIGDGHYPQSVDTVSSCLVVSMKLVI